MAEIKRHFAQKGHDLISHSSQAISVCTGTGLEELQLMEPLQFQQGTWNSPHTCAAVLTSITSSDSPAVPPLLSLVTKNWYRYQQTHREIS